MPINFDDDQDPGIFQIIASFTPIDLVMWVTMIIMITFITSTKENLFTDVTSVIKVILMKFFEW